MEDTSSAVPAGGEAASAPASSTPTAAASGSTASAAAGDAPGGGGDAGVGGESAGTATSATPAAPFSFLKRNFNDQKHAEEVLGSEIQRTRAIQRQNAELERKFAAAEAELNALRGLVVERQPTGRGPDGRPVKEGAGEPKPFATELLEAKSLNLIAKMWNDPEMGPEHAMYHLTELLDKRYQSKISELQEAIDGKLQSRDQRAQIEATTARVFTQAKNLAVEYPELDDNNKSEEAEAAQSVILQMIEDHPGGPQWLAKDATQCLKFFANEYRAKYGTPIFAQPPGTSGSPSARAAAAAEAAGNGGTPAVDGSGVPRQRPSNQPETFAERIKRESRESSSRVARTPSGRPLGFEISGA